MTAKKKPAAAAAFAIEWRCPRCSAPHDEHGEGECSWRHGETCGGFLCECIDTDDGSELPDHGVTFGNPCPTARCYHCGWEGTFPKTPKKLQPWEKRALAEGWTPPEKRRRELVK